MCSSAGDIIATVRTLTRCNEGFVRTARFARIAQSTGVSSVFSLRDNKTSGSHHLEQGGNRLVRADYLELGTLPCEGSSETRQGPVTKIEGGVGVLSQEDNGAMNRVRVSDDHLYMGNGIKKTVRLESHPQQTEDSGTR